MKITDSVITGKARCYRRYLGGYILETRRRESRARAPQYVKGRDHIQAMSAHEVTDHASMTTR